MRPIYHLVSPAAWQAEPAADYRAASLSAEGFIHCSFAAQVSWAANKFYADAAELLVLRIEPARLTSPLRVESAGAAGDFPHVYGPINRDAVNRVSPLARDGAGRWAFDPDHGGN